MLWERQRWRLRIYFFLFIFVFVIFFFLPMWLRMAPGVGLGSWTLWRALEAGPGLLHGQRQ